MSSESTSALQQQISNMKAECNQLRSAAKSAEGLKRVRIKLDETEDEMVNTINTVQMPGINTAGINSRVFVCL